MLCSIYLVFAVFFVFWLNKTIVKDPSANWNNENVKLFNFSFTGIVSSMPLIIFAYMYQVNIPQIYFELERRNYKTMSKVVYFGTFLAVIMYVLIGIFGYITFTNGQLSTD